MNVKRAKELLELHEARRDRMYKCSAGFNTIGIGHNLDANPISERAIDVIFEDDLNVVLNDLTKNLPWWRTLSENRQLVLVDMCFNLGIGRLLGFKKLESIISNIVTTILINKYTLLAMAGALVFAVIFWAVWITLNVAYNRQKRLVYKLLLIVGIIPGVIIDVLFNATVATLLFWELPKETTLSMRLTRYLSGRTPDKLRQTDYGYRVPVALWIATYLVEPWQPGHLGLEKWGYPAANSLIDDLLTWLKRHGI